MAAKFNPLARQAARATMSLSQIARRTAIKRRSKLAGLTASVADYLASIQCRTHIHGVEAIAASVGATLVGCSRGLVVNLTSAARGVRQAQIPVRRPTILTSLRLESSIVLPEGLIGAPPKTPSNQTKG